MARESTLPSLCPTAASARGRSLATGRLLAEATLAVIAARVLLWRWPLRRARAILARVDPTRIPRRQPAAAERIGWAVAAVAARLAPGERCVTRALAAEAVLRRHGHDARLRIGFARDGARLLGHAWVEVDGHSLAGERSRAGRQALEPGVVTPRSGRG